jgi:hypothetical protein
LLIFSIGRRMRSSTLVAVESSESNFILFRDRALSANPST